MAKDTRAGNGWLGGERALLKVLVLLVVGGALGSGGTIAGNRTNGLSHQDVRAEVENSCLYREDRAAVRRDLVRCERAITELTRRVTDLTRSWDKTRGWLELVIERQLGPGATE